jgi:hypothetical protein
VPSTLGICKGSQHVRVASRFRRSPREALHVPPRTAPGAPSHRL